MEGIPKCKKCGRLLKSPASIARRMGPKCAGVSGGRRRVKMRTGRQSGSAYGLGVSGGIQTTLPTEVTTPKRLSKRELAKRNREDRRRLFEGRQSFQCGLLLPERKDSTSGSIISHERLQNYLKQYQFI